MEEEVVHVSDKFCSTVASRDMQSVHVLLSCSVTLARSASSTSVKKGRKFSTFGLSNTIKMHSWDYPKVMKFKPFFVGTQYILFDCHYYQKQHFLRQIFFKKIHQIFLKKIHQIFLKKIHQIFLLIFWSDHRFNLQCLSDYASWHTTYYTHRVHTNLTDEPIFRIIPYPYYK